MNNLDPRAKILIVDDEPGIVETYVNYLKPTGRFEIASARDVAGARQLLEQYSFQVVLLDLDFPHGASGSELFRQLRKAESEFEVIIITGEFPKDAGKYLGEGAADFLVKGQFEEDELLQRVSRAVELGEKRRTRSMIREQTRRDSGAPMLYNRRTLYEMIEGLDFEEDPFFLIFFDIDHFKVYNQTFGHEKANEVIDSVAFAMRDVCDWPYLGDPLGDFASGMSGPGAASPLIPFRYGGDEFAMLGLGDTELAVERILRLRDSFAGYTRKRLNMTPGLSFGVISSELFNHMRTDGSPFSKAFPSVFPPTASPGESFIQAGDCLQELAKQSGRGRVVTDKGLQVHILEIVERVTDCLLIVNKGYSQGLVDPEVVRFNHWKKFGDETVLLSSIPMRVRRLLPENTVLEIEVDGGTLSSDGLIVALEF